MKLKKSISNFFVLLLLPALILTSCSKSNDEPKNPTIPEEENGYEETVPETIKFDKVKVVYYGEDTSDSDLWNLSLYTDMDIDLTGNLIGPGHILRLSCNVTKSPTQKADLSILAGDYTWQTTDSDFTPNTFNWGFKVKYELPTGPVYMDDGSFYGKVKENSTEYDTDLLKEGGFKIEYIGENKIKVTGILVGQQYKKRYIEYEGEITIVDNGTPVVPNSTLTKDITLNNFSKARLEDGGDVFWLQDESYRNFTLILAENDVDLSKLVPTGAGQAMQVDFIVGWDVNVNDGIPEGTYNTTVREENNGVDRNNIIPFNILPGYPGRFQYPSGTWYFEYEKDVLKNYACIKNGKMVVTKKDGRTDIYLEFYDLSDKQHCVKATYSTTEKFPVFYR